MELTDNDPRWAILGWVTGWLNVLGQFATTAFAADILAAHIASMFLIGNGHVFSNVEMLLAYAGQHEFCATHQCIIISVSSFDAELWLRKKAALHFFACFEHVKCCECPYSQVQPVSCQRSA